MDATDYALRKVVRNSAIVREVDEVRQREMWQWACMAAVLVLVLLASVWMHMQFRQLDYRAETLQSARAAEAEKNRVLRLRIETLKAPQRIEQMARDTLHMVDPAPGESIVIDRVAVPAHPATSIVAAR